MNNIISALKNQYPIPCVRIFLINQKNEILFGKRTDCKLYGLPGGKIEMFEEPEETAVRELKEETDILLQLNDLKLIKVKNIHNKEFGLHYINFYYLAKIFDIQNIKNMEIDKNEEWVWMNVDTLKERYEEIFWGIKIFSKDYKSLQEMIESFKSL